MALVRRTALQVGATLTQVLEGLSHSLTTLKRQHYLALRNSDTGAGVPCRATWCCNLTHPFGPLKLGCPTSSLEKNTHYIPVCLSFFLSSFFCVCVWPGIHTHTHACTLKLFPRTHFLHFFVIRFGNLSISISASLSFPLSFPSEVQQLSLHL